MVGARTATVKDIEILYNWEHKTLAHSISAPVEAGNVKKISTNPCVDYSDSLITSYSEHIHTNSLANWQSAWSTMHH